MDIYFDEERGLFVDENGFVDPLCTPSYRGRKTRDEIEQWSDLPLAILDEDDIDLLHSEEPYNTPYTQK